MLEKELFLRGVTTI